MSECAEVLKVLQMAAERGDRVRRVPRRSRVGDQGRQQLPGSFWKSGEIDTVENVCEAGGMAKGLAQLDVKAARTLV